MRSRHVLSRLALVASATVVLMVLAAPALGGVHKTILLEHFGDCC